ncbi:MAG: hypothetical protein RIQ52_1685 [Pseudomonadota bacterium]
MAAPDILQHVDEFSLIRRYFSHAPEPLETSGVWLGVGDDCALLQPSAATRLAVTMDTLVAGVHFFQDTDAMRLGHKALAVNLSDLAAMGATPRWVMLALTLPAPDQDWLAAFMAGFMALARLHGVSLVGGDTTRGPLSITVQAMGEVPVSVSGMRRDAARAGDLVCLSGQVGLAGLALRQILRGDLLPEPSAMDALEKPMPQVLMGVLLRDLVHACIDVSDGLAQDLGHILQASQVGATLIWEQLPLAGCVRDDCLMAEDPFMPLTAGDDYQLCFTVPPERMQALEQRLADHALSCHVIGCIEAEPGLRIRMKDQIHALPVCGYQHFV